MENINSVKATILGIIGIAGSAAAHYLGGWDMALQVLVILMAADYITGILVAAVFNKSKKSTTGKLDSKAGFKGLCKKGMILIIVLVAHLLDEVSGTDVIRNTAIIAYIANETISIIENADLMGVPIPSIIRKALELMQNKSEQQEVE